MTSPSGEQHLIEADGYTAVVTGSGATLRHLSHEGRELVQGFEQDAMTSGARGQVLMPWPNRIRDGAYSFGGRDLQLPLSEPARHNASHGLVRWVTWRLLDHGTDSVVLGCLLNAQPGYPWSLDLTLRYALSDEGLSVGMSAVNLADSPAPFAAGMHPYLSIGGPVDPAELTLPGAVRLLTDDERKLPTGTQDVEGTAYDFRSGRTLGDTVLDHAFTDLARDEDGRARVRLTSPQGFGVELWADESYRWLQAYTADDQGERARSALAVEPMTSPPDAFRSGEDLLVLEPGARFTGAWGLRAT